MSDERKRAKRLNKRQRRIMEAASMMHGYAASYSVEVSKNKPDYHDKTFVNDMLFGIALALGYPSNADGFAKFKWDWCRE